MKTKRTSKTLQERLQCLHGLYDNLEESEAFLGAPGSNESYTLKFDAHAKYSWREFTVTVSRKALFDLVENEMVSDRQQIEAILEELGLEE